MRDPKRIDKFCDDLKALWHCVPDWRFGQLMSNMLGAYVAQTKRDIFFPEDNELMKFFTKYMREATGISLNARQLLQEIASSKARCATLSRRLEEEKKRYANLESAIKTEFDYGENDML